MKTDFYTKTVLTVIAGVLIIIAFQNTDFFQRANASKLNTGILSVPVNPDGSINLKFTETMKVNITEIGGNYISGTLPVNMKEVNGNSISGSNGLPVNIEAVDGSNIYNAIPVKMKE